MQSDLAHAVQFLQAAIAIILGLALGEALKQFVPDGDKDIRKDRGPLLFAFFFMKVALFLQHPTPDAQYRYRLATCQSVNIPAASEKT